jgi:hypothetical protein
MATGTSNMVWAIGSRAELFAFFAFCFRLAGGKRSRCAREREKATAKSAKTRKERK